MPKAAITPPAVGSKPMPTVRNAGPRSARPPSSSTSSRGKTTAAEAARQHALTLAEVEQWKEDFITQAPRALRSHPRDLAQQFEAREKTLLAKVSELTPACGRFKKAHRYLGRTCRKGSRGSHAKPTSNRDPRRCL
ncbi:MAG: hypothetical protein HS117_13280 [Verrucomicrobiaceae bacterium]|nr:hypothetical protein [Verrucomicrobiaceae bacterium]